jgi:hypothetical protein
MTRQPSKSPKWHAVTVGKAPNGEDAVFCDFDSDGRWDVITASEGNTRKILVHWAPTEVADYSNAKKWKSETLYEDGSRWMFSVPMDVDGQHGLDIVCGGKDKDAKIGWLERPTHPRNVADWKFHELSEAGWIMSLIVEDMNGDGQPDLLLSDRRGSLSGVRWLEHPGKNSSRLRDPWKNHWVGGQGREVMLICAHDFDQDGIKEIVVPYYREKLQGLSLFKRTAANKTRTGGGSWQEYPILYPPLVGRPKAASVGDINLDGKPDIVLSTGAAHGFKQGIVWLEYATSPLDPVWKAHEVSGPTGVKFDLNLLLDVDGDGDLDILNTEEAVKTPGGNLGLGLVWYENPVR